MQIQKNQLARYALNTEIYNLPLILRKLFKSINAVTIEDIKDVAKYFLADNIRVLVVGKGSEVAPHWRN
jgi:predicted Zn-dependent peptidase